LLRSQEYFFYELSVKIRDKNSENNKETLSMGLQFFLVKVELFRELKKTGKCNLHAFFH